MLGVRCLAVLGGPDMQVSLLRRWTNSADYVIAADGGANSLAEIGDPYDVVLGDFDSVRPEARKLARREIHLEDQSKTDGEKLFDWVVAAGQKHITVVGAEGGSPDHFWGVFHSFIRSDIKIFLGFQRGLGWVLRPGDVLDVPTRLGQRVSLMPLVQCRGVELTGVEWPLGSVELALGQLVSVSNKATGDQVQVRIEEGYAWLYVETPESDMPYWSV
jgi:thiamine pyrophosphokinase